MHFRRPLAPFGLPLPPFCLHSGTLWLPFGSLWIPFGSLRLPLTALLLPLAGPLACCSFFLHYFGGSILFGCVLPFYFALRRFVSCRIASRCFVCLRVNFVFFRCIVVSRRVALCWFRFVFVLKTMRAAGRRSVFILGCDVSCRVVLYRVVWFLCVLIPPQSFLRCIGVSNHMTPCFTASFSRQIRKHC